MTGASASAVTAEVPVPGGPDRRPAIVAAAVLAAGVVVALALLAGWALAGAGGPASPGDGSVDAGFARDMQVHHNQAVEMSVVVRDRSDDPAVRGMALDILLTQQQQSGQMYGWLETWGLPQASSTPPMQWMGMAGMPMMGLASQQDMRLLGEAEGVQAERLFLELMIAHHAGGIQMAERAAQDAAQPEVRALAEAMAASQEVETAALEDLLAQRQD